MAELNVSADPSACPFLSSASPLGGREMGGDRPDQRPRPPEHLMLRRLTALRLLHQPASPSPSPCSAIPASSAHFRFLMFPPHFFDSP